MNIVFNVEQVVDMYESGMIRESSETEENSNPHLHNGIIWFDGYQQYRQTMCDLGFPHLSDRVCYQEWETLVRRKLKEKCDLLKCCPALKAFHYWCKTHPEASQKEKQARFMLYLL